MAMGIFKQLESPLDITTSTIMRRIVANHEAYQVCRFSLFFHRFVFLTQYYVWSLCEEFVHAPFISNVVFLGAEKK